MPDRTCNGCGVDIAHKRADARYCTKLCRDRARPNNGHRVIGTRTCEWCSKEFDVLTDKPDRRGCSISCGRQIRNRERPKPEPAGSTDVPWSCCMQCREWFIARGNRTRCQQTECKRERQREYMRSYYADRPAVAQTVVGLYHLATEQLDVSQASMWRQHLVAYLRSRDGDKCPLCRKPIDFAAKSGPRGSDRGSSVDHVIPKSLGGPDTLANLRLTCWGCNRDRGNRGGGEQLALVG